MIQARGLVKKYGAFTAVNGINLDIPAGEIYGFLGPNGSGKTSTILMLLGIVRPSAGEIRLFDTVYTPERMDLRRRIGVVPEKHPAGMWKWMTAWEYLSLFAELFRIPFAKDRIEMLLRRVNLYDLRHKRIAGFSRGMLQKTSIVRALLHDPDILFLDEPISGLDPMGVKEVRDLIIRENREGRTIFISSHMLSEMEKICHRLAIIHRGKITAEGEINNFLSRLVKDREIQVELKSLPPSLAGEIRVLPFVRDCTVVNNTLNITVPSDGDHRESIAEFLIRRNLVPLRIQEKLLSLEEAFITITGENVDMFASPGSRG